MARPIANLIHHRAITSVNPGLAGLVAKTNRTSAIMHDRGAPVWVVRDRPRRHRKGVFSSGRADLSWICVEEGDGGAHLPENSGGHHGHLRPHSPKLNAWHGGMGRARPTAIGGDRTVLAPPRVIAVDRIRARNRPGGSGCGRATAIPSLGMALGPTRETTTATPRQQADVPGGASSETRRSRHAVTQAGGCS